jgi:CheY-like chemotaxis protein
MNRKGRANIIIADDDEDDQLFLRRAISELYPEHNIVSVYNGSELLDYLLRTGKFSNETGHPPLCIFLDINMPLLCGFGALEKIKMHHALKDIPVHILSTCNLEEYKEKAKALGACGFHTKVCNPEKLKVIVFSVLSQISLRTNFQSENFSLTP